MEGLVLHEDHVTYFESSDEVLNGWTEVAATSPDIFNKSDFIGVNLQLLSEPSVVELYALILEESILLRVVEYLNTKHDESTVVTTSDTNVIKIVESHAKLRTDQGVGRGIKLTSDAVWLETEDSSSHIVNIVSPSSYNWVSFD